MTKYSKYIKRAKDLGAVDAKFILTNTVVTGDWVRIKCQFGCGGFGRSLTCPPNSPTSEQTKRLLSNYVDALLIHTDGTVEINEIVPVLEQELFFDGYYKAFGIGSGPCERCEKCPDFCKHPSEARPAMEACGIDVFGTVRAHGFPIEVLTKKDCKGNYYGLVLIE